MSVAERDCIGWLPVCGVKNRRRTFNVCVTSLKNEKEGNTKKGEKEDKGDDREKEGTRELRFASQGQDKPRPKTARQLPSSPNRSLYRRKVLNSDTLEGPRETEPSFLRERRQKMTQQL